MSKTPLLDAVLIAEKTISLLYKIIDLSRNKSKNIDEYERIEKEIKKMKKALWDLFSEAQKLYSHWVDYKDSSGADNSYYETVPETRVIYDIGQILEYLKFYIFIPSEEDIKELEEDMKILKELSKKAKNLAIKAGEKK